MVEFNKQAPQPRNFITAQQAPVDTSEATLINNMAKVTGNTIELADNLREQSLIANINEEIVDIEDGVISGIQNQTNKLFEAERQGRLRGASVASQLNKLEARAIAENPDKASIIRKQFTNIRGSSSTLAAEQAQSKLMNSVVTSAANKYGAQTLVYYPGTSQIDMEASFAQAAKLTAQDSEFTAKAQQLASDEKVRLAITNFDSKAAELIGTTLTNLPNALAGIESQGKDSTAFLAQLRTTEAALLQDSEQLYIDSGYSRDEIKTIQDTISNKFNIMYGMLNNFSADEATRLNRQVTANQMDMFNSAPQIAKLYSVLGQSGLSNVLASGSLSSIQLNKSLGAQVESFLSDPTSAAPITDPKVSTVNATNQLSGLLDGSRTFQQLTPDEQETQASLVADSLAALNRMPTQQTTDMNKMAWANASANLIGLASTTPTEENLTNLSTNFGPSWRSKYVTLSADPTVGQQVKEAGAVVKTAMIETLNNLTLGRPTQEQRGIFGGSTGITVEYNTATSRYEVKDISEELAADDNAFEALGSGLGGIVNSLTRQAIQGISGVPSASDRARALNNILDNLVVLKDTDPFLSKLSDREVRDAVAKTSNRRTFENARNIRKQYDPVSRSLSTIQE